MAAEAATLESEAAAVALAAGSPPSGGARPGGVGPSDLGGANGTGASAGGDQRCGAVRAFDLRLGGRRALVTGAGSGIGRAIALQLARCGARLVALDKDAEGLLSLAEELGPEAEVQMVTADLEQHEATVAAAKEAGAIDLLVNCAGVGVMQSFLDVDPAAMALMFEVNMRAVVDISQVVARGMVERGQGGAIVHVSSQSSATGIRQRCAYSMTKAGIDSLTRSMAVELGQHGIRTNAVNPTVVMTPLGRAAWQDPKKQKPMLDSIPLGRFAEPEDIADVVTYLLSDRAAMLNGLTLPVDGGFLATRAQLP